MSAKTTQIKIELLRRGLSVSALARKFGCRRQELSMCIRGARSYPKLRTALATELQIPEDKLFPESPATKGRAA